MTSGYKLCKNLMIINGLTQLKEFSALNAADETLQQSDTDSLKG